MAFPDVSQVLRGDALREEDRVWNELIHEKEQLADILADYKFRTVLEIGCGTGLYARILRQRYPHITYYGLDSNPEAIVLAQERNPDTYFRCIDFREQSFAKPHDLACAHAFLKHFSIEEWPALFTKFLSLAPLAQFDMQTAVSTLNDGSESFGNNLWVAEDLFRDTLKQSGHVIRYARVAWQQHDRKATIYITEAT